MLYKYKVALLALILLSALEVVLVKWSSKRFTVNTATLDFIPKLREAAHVKSVKLKQSIFGSREWRQYLPEIDFLLSEIEAGNVEMPKDINKTTDARHTEVIVSKVSGFEMGKTFEGYIQARDHEGRKKRYGGDYFRVRLMRVVNENGDLSYDGVPVTVKDERNGRYKFKTRIPWSGRSKLIVELMHPSEAVFDLIRKTRPTYAHRVSFLGTFPSGYKAHCDVWLGNKDLCNFSEPENGIRWVCARPVNQSCPREVKWWEKQLFYVIPSLKSGPLFKNGVNYQTEINGSGLIIHSKRSEHRTSKHLLSCTTYVQKGDENDVSGYFQDNVWHSTNCNNTIKSLVAAKSCLRNKTIYFIGDSTTRQWHLQLVSFLKLRDHAFGNAKVSWSVSRTAKDSENNFVMKFRAHGMPLGNPGTRESRPPIVETLNKINDPDGKDVIIVFTLGAHFVLNDPEVFLERLSAIKHALINLRKRLPIVKAFVKGSVRNRDQSGFIPSEWLVHRYDRILRQFFTDFPYIDTWSMTTVQPQKDVHADRTMIHHFISLFLSHVCKS